MLRQNLNVASRVITSEIQSSKFFVLLTKFMACIFIIKDKYIHTY